MLSLYILFWYIARIASKHTICENYLRLGREALLNQWKMPLLKEKNYAKPEMSI